jgi:hypothetical protein
MLASLENELRFPGPLGAQQTTSVELPIMPPGVTDGNPPLLEASPHGRRTVRHSVQIACLSRPDFASESKLWSKSDPEVKCLAVRFAATRRIRSARPHTG